MSSYEEICDAVWGLYESLQHVHIGNGQQRNLLFPPAPRGRQVDLLIVGISPNHDAAIDYSHDRQELDRFAREFEYVSEAGNPDPRLHWDTFYAKLLKLSRRIDPQFGVWRQVEQGQKKRLVEFTDCLHIATQPGDKDDIWRVFTQPIENCRVWRRCKEILEAELRLYQPKVVIGNGRQPSDMLWEICKGRRVGNPPEDSMILNSRFGCNVHLSGFITRQSMDGYSRTRLVREIKQFFPSLANE